MFVVGNIIRNKRPYWGEPMWRIDDVDEKQTYAVRGPGKFGLWDNPKYRQILFNHQLPSYRKAYWWEKIWLHIVGFITK